MSNFDGPLVIQYDPHASRILKGDYWQVRKSFRFYLPPTIDDLAEGVISNRWAQVSAGMLTDLGSVPKVFRSFIDRDGDGAQAFVLHDQLCEYLSVTEDGGPQHINRSEADAILFYALIDLGVSVAEARIIYSAVSAYSATRCNTCPSTYRLKRDLEAAYNFEGLE